MIDETSLTTHPMPTDIADGYRRFMQEVPRDRQDSKYGTAGSASKQKPFRKYRIRTGIRFTRRSAQLVVCTMRDNETFRIDNIAKLEPTAGLEPATC
jgi:hypothetical protein